MLSIYSFMTTTRKEEAKAFIFRPYSCYIDYMLCHWERLFKVQLTVYGNYCCVVILDKMT